MCCHSSATHGNSVHDRFANWGHSIESQFNRGIDKISGKTFEAVGKLKTTHSDNILVKIGKIFAAVIGTVTILPLVGLFAAAGAVKAFHAIHQLIHRQRTTTA